MSSSEITEDKVVKLCRTVLSNDEADESIVILPFLKRAIQNWLRTNKDDTNFIIEIGGGQNGFGVVTCMDQCWVDIPLTPLSAHVCADGGKSDGLGSLEAYHNHCKLPDHVLARNERVKEDLAAEKRRANKATRKLGATGSSQAMLAKQAEASSSQTAREQVRSVWANRDMGNASAGPRSQVKKEPSFSGSASNSYTAPATRDFPMNLDSSSDESEARHKPGALAIYSPNRSTKKSKVMMPESDSEVEFVSSKKPITKSKNHDRDGDFQMLDVKPKLEDLKPTSRKLNAASSWDAIMKRQPVAGPSHAGPSNDVKPDVKPNVDPWRQDLQRGLDSARGSAPQRAPSQLSERLVNEKKKLADELALLQAALLTCYTASHKKSLTSRIMAINGLISQVGAGRMPTWYPPILRILNLIPSIDLIRPDEARLRIAREKSAADAQAKRVAEYAAIIAARQPQVPAAPNPFENYAAMIGAAQPQVQAAPNPYENYAPFPQYIPYQAPPALGMPGAFPGMDDDDAMGVPVAGGQMGVVPYLPPGIEDEEERRLHQEPQLRADEMMDYFNDALKEFQDDESVVESFAKLGLASVDDIIPGMTVKLMPHQLIGVAWMLKMERDRKCKGGILADTMGLGKTVQALAVSMKNNSEDPDRKTTLLVAPLAILNQWKLEIEQKCIGQHVLIYHGPKKPLKAKTLRKFDWILTTYSTLANDFPKEKKKKKRKRGPAGDFIEEDEDGADEPFERPYGPLSKVYWHRIILDEGEHYKNARVSRFADGLETRLAHTIRNKSTQAAKACFALEGEYRWYLSGTPIVNTLVDLYSALHFVSISPCADWEVFQRRVGKIQGRNARLAAHRIQLILKTACLRRTPETKMADGKKILQLVPKTEEMILETFDPDERAIYDAVEARARVRLNKFIREGTVMRNYSVVLVMLLRLRQLANHPHLITRRRGTAGPNDLVVMADDFLAPEAPMINENSSKEEVIAAAHRLGGDVLVDKLRRKFIRRAEGPINADEEEDDENSDMSCPICYDSPFKAEYVTVPCLHSFCRGCILDVLDQPAPVNGLRDVAEGAAAAGVRPCPICRGDISPGHILPASAFDVELRIEDVKPDIDDVKPSFGMGERSGSKLYGGKVKDEDFDESDDEKPKPNKGKGRANFEGIDLEEEILPSTKQKKAVDLIEGWLANKKEDNRIICFSQFTGFIDIIENDLQRRGIKVLTFDGRMSKGTRDDNVESFMEPGSKYRVMLISTKAGNVGLNLTAANKVLLLDFTWNPASELQAIGRAHRIGQQRDVEVVRVAMNNSVEQRIMDLQVKKQALADGAYGEGAGGKIGRLNLAEIRQLFNA